MRYISLFLMMCFLSACANVTIDQLERTNRIIDNVWKEQGAAINRDIGQRILPVPPEVALLKLEKVLTSLGMWTVKKSTNPAFLIAKSTAPTPLNEQEWESVRQNEEPFVKEIAKQQMGYIASTQIRLQPEHYALLFGAEISEHEDGAYLKMRGNLLYIGPLQNVYTPKSIPPSALRIGYEKIITEMIK